MGKNQKSEKAKKDKDASQFKQNLACSDSEFVPRAVPTTRLAKLVVETKDNIADFRKLVELLCSRTESCDVNELDDTGFTALYYAVGFGELEKVTILLELGANPNVENCMGMTPIFHATGRNPDIKIAEILIKHGADVQHKTKTGASPLHGACLQGNKDCIKLLIKHGADPRACDDEGTTPLDLAKDNETREILHNANRHEDSKEDKKEKSTDGCGISEDEPGVKLKRCSSCLGVLYCSKNCQKKDWKENGHKTKCEGFVIGYPGDTPDGLYTSSLSTVFGSKQPTFSVHKVFPGQKEHEKAKALKDKRFVVKVQVPQGGMGSMMVYNEDRSVHFFIHSSAPGYFALLKKIQEEGFMSMKGYFWAERTQKTDGGVKVFHSKLAPFQRW